MGCFSSMEGGAGYATHLVIGELWNMRGRVGVIRGQEWRCYLQNKPFTKYSLK
jgi:hypothetical protein